MTFRLHYFLLTILIFAIEVLIALFVRDAIIRPYVGDLLVVVLIYCFVRTFLKISVKFAAIGTLVFAFFVEFLQFIKIVDTLGLSENRSARVVIGTSFSWEDLVMYVVGILVVVFFEKMNAEKGFK